MFIMGYSALKTAFSKRNTALFNRKMQGALI